MNISNIILQLNNLANQSPDAFTLMLLAKSIEKLKVGAVTVVGSTAQLPSSSTSDIGEIYLISGDDELYANNGTRWVSLISEQVTAGIAYAWGYNEAGQVGTGESGYGTHKSSPVSVIGGITNWSQVSAGGSHSLGVTSDGIAYAWGYNAYGRLGTGESGSGTQKSSPVSVIGGITNWSQVSAGAFHSLGVTSNGIAYAWGYNGSGQVGTGESGFGTEKSSPVSVIGGITNWSQVSAGGSHSLGVTSNGIAYAWGFNYDGRLGTGESGFGTEKSSPVSVVGGITNWAQVSAGYSHSLGVTSNGIAYAWGLNSFGPLGDGTETARNSPVSVIGGITNWAQVSAGTFHSLGVTSDGIAYGWGYNGNDGRLGTGESGSGTSKSSPVSVIGGITNWSQVSAGGSHSLGITADGIAYGWGYNRYGRLGTGESGSGTEKSSPVSVIGGITNWAQVSAGSDHSLGVAASEFS